MGQKPQAVGRSRIKKATSYYGISKKAGTSIKRGIVERDYNPMMAKRKKARSHRS